MAGKLRILILEDRKEDARLMERELRAGGLSFESLVVETEDTYIMGIKDFHPQLILADYRLPTLDGMIALTLAKVKAPEIPFIFVSGTIGEDRAIETLKQGATDYVLKDRLSRLVPVVQRALKEVEIQRLKRKSEEELRESEARFRASFEQAGVGIAQVAPGGRWLWMNRKLCEIVGYSKQELLERTYLDITHPDDLETNLRIVEQVLAGETDRYSFEKRYIRKDGQVVWANITTSLTRQPDGRPKFFISVVEDITERKRAREALFLSERHYRSLFDNMLNGYSYCKMHFEQNQPKDFSYLEVNGAFEALTGLKGVVGRKASETIPGLLESDLELLERYGRVALTGTPERFEYHVKALKMWFSIAVYSPQPEHFVAIFDVITERKQAEVALKQSEEFKNAVLDSMPSHISVLDRNGVILAVNEPWINFSIINNIMDSVPAHRTEIGVNYLEVCKESRGESSEEAMAAYDGIRAVLDGKLESFTLEYPCHSPRSQRWFLMTVTPLGERERGVVISHTDITSRRQAEEERLQVEAQLRQAQKMEALGTLAGGIAHDFNNILGIIMGYTEMARLRANEDGSAAKELQQVLAATHRAKDLVQQILAFSRKREQHDQPVQPSLLAKEVLKMLRASLPSTIEIKPNVTSKSVVTADPTQIHQVLMNLCTNAAHAMREHGGTLKVTLSDVELTPEAIRLFGLAPGLYVQLVVGDSGHGIDPEIIDRIFDPFFTTKEQGEGTGLGLSVVHGIVKGYGGAVEVESTLGRGTSFKVLLPALENEAGAPAIKTAPLPRGAEKLLLVDDEPALGGVLKRMLERLGYEVEYHMNGTDALEAFRRQTPEKPFRLAITDMTMPQLTGTDLARELLKIQPDLPIVLCTGFNETISQNKARSLGIQGFLMKPVTMKDLAEVVRAMLDPKL